jgi:hypothetical protein
MRSGLLGTAMRVPLTAPRLYPAKSVDPESVCHFLDTHKRRSRCLLMPWGTYYGLSIAAIALTKDDGITAKGDCRRGDAAVSVNAAGYLATACWISTDRAVEGTMVKTVGTAMLSHFLSKNILQICHNQYNPKSNCAHFIGHALGIKVGDTNCYNVAPAGIPKPGLGFTIRVDDLSTFGAQTRACGRTSQQRFRTVCSSFQFRAMYPVLRFGWGETTRNMWESM